jgi:hypothetical protein
MSVEVEIYVANAACKCFYPRIFIVYEYWLLPFIWLNQRSKLLSHCFFSLRIKRTACHLDLFPKSLHGIELQILDILSSGVQIKLRDIAIASLIHISRHQTHQTPRHHGLPILHPPPLHLAANLPNRNHPQRTKPRPIPPPPNRRQTTPSRPDSRPNGRRQDPPSPGPTQRHPVPGPHTSALHRRHLQSLPPLLPIHNRLPNPADRLPGHRNRCPAVADHGVRVCF